MERILSAVIKIAGLIVKTEEFDYFKQICINNWEVWILSHFSKSHEILETLQLIYIKRTKFGAFHQVRLRILTFLQFIISWLLVQLKTAPRDITLSHMSHKKFKEILYELVSALNLDEMTMYKEEATCLSSCENSDTVF